MRFHDHFTMYAQFKRDHGFPRPTSPSEFYRMVIADIAKNQPQNPTEVDLERLRVGWVMSVTEATWFEECRPYYKVWPSVIRSLTSIKLDVNLAGVVQSRAVKSINIRFAEGSEPASGQIAIRSILLTYIPDGRVFCIDGPALSCESHCITTDTKVPLVLPPIPFNCSRDAGSIEDQLHSTGAINLGGVSDRECERLLEQSVPTVNLACRIGMSVLLLENDPSIIKPDVLAADREAYDRTGDPKYIDRAKKKGIVGWRIGEEYETCPHFRRPHFALRHTGKGRTIPRIVPVKAAFIHRNKLTAVPTGWMTPDGIEVEPK